MVERLTLFPDEPADEDSLLFELPPTEKNMASIVGEALERTQLRIVELPTVATAHRRILNTLDNARPYELQDGLEWYFHALELCEIWAMDYGLAAEQVAGIIAAFSPLRSWESNLIIAKMYIETGDCPALSHPKATARAILDGISPEEAICKKEKNNPKVRAFYRNMAFPETSRDVTIDRHMWTLLLDDPEAVKKAGLYFTRQENTWAQDIFRELADRLDVLPHQLQAATWVVQRRLRSEQIGKDQLLLFDHL